MQAACTLVLTMSTAANRTHALFSRPPRGFALLFIFLFLAWGGGTTDKYRRSSPLPVCIVYSVLILSSPYKRWPLWHSSRERNGAAPHLPRKVAREVVKRQGSERHECCRTRRGSRRLFFLLSLQDLAHLVLWPPFPSVLLMFYCLSSELFRILLLNASQRVTSPLFPCRVGTVFYLGLTPDCQRTRTWSFKGPAISESSFLTFLPAGITHLPSLSPLPSAPAAPASVGDAVVKQR